MIDREFLPTFLREPEPPRPTPGRVDGHRTAPLWALFVAWLLVLLKRP